MNSLVHTWDKVRKREWGQIRDAWLADIPQFSTLGAKPDPGLENLDSLRAIRPPEKDGQPVRVENVPGIRRNAMWEAVFLFHKCSHTTLAAQRLAHQGMHSWCMFNAYHAAYLGAKGILELLGVAFPSLSGKQMMIDLFPEPIKPQKKSLISSKFGDFLIIRLSKQLDQGLLWEAFQRVLRISSGLSCDQIVIKELVGISYSEFTPTRNHFLYQAQFWLLNDLMVDAALAGMNELVGTELNPDEGGFLLRLCFSVHLLFEQLMSDLGEYSTIIKEQVEGLRRPSEPELADFDCYNTFLSQVGTGTVPA